MIAQETASKDIKMYLHELTGDKHDIAIDWVLVPDDTWDACSGRVCV